MNPKYKRVLLKLSGEALAGEQKMGYDFKILTDICEKIKVLANNGVEVGVVVGGGNFWRGRSSGTMDRTTADQMGMLATVMNSLAVADTLKSLGEDAVVMTSVHMIPIAEPFVKDNAVKYLEQGKIVVFGCGTGSPFFSTDTTASLRAAEINADVVLKATMVDGVYDSDPKKNPNAKKYDTLTFSEVLKNELAVMDSTAASMCKDNKIKLLVFSMVESENIVKAVMGENIGTLVTE
ncbi:MAG: UMP kinase [Oscillospiraceae bacterium]